MKKFLLPIICFLFSLGKIRAEMSAIQWVATSDGIEMEIPETIKANTDGDIFILANFYSSTLPDVETGINKKKHGITTGYTLYNPETGASNIQTTSTGTPDDLSVSGTANMVLYKVDKKGNVLWRINSNVGHFSSGVMAPTSDGGVMVGLKMKHSVQAVYKPETLVRFVDANDEETEVLWDAPDYATYGGVYQPVLVKIDGNGLIEWTKRIPVDYKIETINGSQKKFNDNFDFADMIADSENNIYITGNYRTSINFGRQANLSSPHNVTDWNGDIQETRGDMFLVKIDISGSAKWNVVTQGEVTCERPQSLDFDGTNIYLVGYMKGNSDKSLSAKLGDIRLTPSGSDCLYYACISVEGIVNWVHMLEAAKNEEGAARIKPTSVSVNKEENSLLLSGSFLGYMVQGVDSILKNPNPSTMGLRPYILQCDPETGNIQQVYTRLNGTLAEIQSAFRIEDKIYATGYQLYGFEFLISFDAELENAEENNLFVCSEVSSQGSIIVDSLLIVAGRARTSSSITFPGSDLKVGTVENGWACVFTCHNLLDTFDAPELSGISYMKNIAELTVYASNSGLIIESSDACSVHIYSINGQLFETFEAEKNSVYFVSLPKGVYFVNNRKSVVY